jgi:hypothetical protein
MSDQFSIEARSLNIVGVASHNFWVLRNLTTGQVIAELDGLAFNRISQMVVPIGTINDDSLRTFQYVHDDSYISKIGATTKAAVPQYQSGQASRTVFTGDEAAALDRWNTAVNAIPLLNRLDLDYPSLGFSFGETVNSNSAYRTFGELMGVTVYDFPWVVEPGFDNRMLSPQEIDKLKFDSGLPSSSRDWNSIFALADSVDASGNALLNLGANTSSSSIFSGIDVMLNQDIDLGLLNSVTYNGFNDFYSDYLLDSSSFDLSLNPGFSFDLNLNPIGALYETVTPANDLSPSIADKTPVLVGANNQGLSVAALTNMDANHDGILNGAELTDLNAWFDRNENGLRDTGEFQPLTQAGISQINSSDYGFYIQGNAVGGAGVAAVPARPDEASGVPSDIAAMPVSNMYKSYGPGNSYYNFRYYRDYYNTYWWTNGRDLYQKDWTPSEIKINFYYQDFLIGTDNADGYIGSDGSVHPVNANYYPSNINGDYLAYGAFPTHLLHYFLAGGGDDVFGGSDRSDYVSGGTGNDILFGYKGDDDVYADSSLKCNFD